MTIKSLAILLLLAICSTIGRGQEKLTPALWERIKAESPKLPPQSPAVKRETTDTQNERLKGKVKQVIKEYQSYADICSTRGRFLNGIDDYDVEGNTVRNVQFGNCGELTGIIVYGFLDGFRVGLYKDVYSLRGRFAVAGSSPEKPNPATQKPDQRYTYKYEYSYSEGNLTLMRMFYNDGRRGMYYKYSTSARERSISAFTQDDEPNWRAVYKLDEKGNEIEYISVDVRKVYGYDPVYRIQNKSFDQAGNWTRRSTFEIKSEGNEPSSKLISEEFRTITYY